MKKTRLIGLIFGILLIFISLYLIFFDFCQIALGSVADDPSNCKISDFPDYFNSTWDQTSDRNAHLPIILIYLVLFMIPGIILIYKNRKL